MTIGDWCMVFGKRGPGNKWGAGFKPILSPKQWRAGEKLGSRYNPRDAIIIVRVKEIKK